MAFAHAESLRFVRVFAAEARVALQALVRRDELDPAARITLFEELAAYFKNIVTFPPEIVGAMAMNTMCATS